MNKSPFSPTFCVYPWMEFLLGPNKNSKLCCIAEEPLLSSSGEIYPLDKFSPSEIWNSEGMQRVREKMLAGEKINACRHCYYQEKIGRPSYRELFNQRWLSSSFGIEIVRRVKYSNKNNYMVDAPPIYLDIRPGNLCNLKCRMCNPSNSSQIYKEHSELLTENKDFGLLIDENVLNQDHEFFNWHESSKIWEVVHKWAPGVKKLYFTGGEPTLIEKNWELINYFKEKGYSKNVSLVFNINCTYIPDKLLNTFNDFFSVSILFSVDGHKKIQEYIRYPSRWDIIEKNIKKVLKNKKKNVAVAFTPVVQIYNILHLASFLEWVDCLQEEYGKIGVSLLMCTTPEYFNMAILPQKIRDIAFDNIDAYQKNYKGTNYFLIECLDSIKNVLRGDEKENHSFQLKKFFEYTSILDNKRENSFEKSIPYLHKLLQEQNLRF